MRGVRLHVVAVELLLPGERSRSRSISRQAPCNLIQESSF